MSLTAEQITENINKVHSFVSKIKDDERRNAVQLLLEKLDERFAIAPASSRLKQHSCFPGGLVDHSIRVLANALKIKDFYPENNISKDSLIIVCLFHDLGKVGDLENDYYEPQTSEWHKDKLGELYVQNKKLTYMTVPHRSLWLLQQFGIKLTQEEFVAVMIHDGQYTDANKPYSMKECMLADILHVADYLACKQESDYAEY